MKNSRVYSCQVAAIGKIVTEDGKVFAILDKKYAPGLKNLDKFSHANIISCTNKHRGESILLRSSLNSEIQFILFTVAVKEVDEEKGRIRLECVEVDAPVPVYDIKPYFPVEDRIREPLLPRCFSMLPMWVDQYRISLKDDIIEKQNIPKVLTSIGTYSRKNQKDVVILHDAQREKLLVLKEFSHARIIWWFSRFENDNFREILQGKPPYENAPKTRVFGSRSPLRPTPLH